ncbi:MAG: hypothetical protein AB1403_02925 [Candidatus Riflebacteria bacterium]
MQKIENDHVLKLVAKSEFSLPDKPAGEKARSLLRDFWRGFTAAEEDEKKVDVQAELRFAPPSLLDWVAPYPDWSNFSDGIFDSFQPWLETTGSDDFFRIVVAPPGSGLKEILAAIAEKNGWPIVSAPDYAQLAGRDYSWIDKLPRSNEVPLVIPGLEAMFLRHFNGLEHLRLLIDKLFHLHQRCFIGCNSWLWEYLDVAMQFGDSFSEPFFMQSLNAQDLQNFFCGLEAQKGPNVTIFRQADNGSFILPFEITAEGKLDPILIAEFEARKEDYPSEFLKKLAVESRGIPLIAWSIWRNSLRLAPQEEVADAARDAAVADSGKTIWVKPFEKLVMPKMPAVSQQAASFLLQFLLLHDGLPPDLIHELLGFEKDQVVSLLHSLKKAGIVVAERGLWRVSWQGYPEVRRFLAQQDYLLDSM